MTGGKSQTAPQSPYDITGAGNITRQGDGLATRNIKTTGPAEGMNDLSSKRPEPHQP